MQVDYLSSTRKFCERIGLPEYATGALYKGPASIKSACLDEVEVYELGLIRV
jgi:hypothetical protein